MRESNVRRTPKVFNSSYRPPRTGPSVDLRQLKYIFIVLLILAGLYGITKVPAFRISNIQIDTDNQLLLDEVNKLQGQSLLGSAVTSMNNEILANNLSIKTLECSKGIPSTVKCFVTFREPVFNWQGKDGKIGLLDNNGLLFEEVTVPKEGAMLVSDNSMDFKVGEVVVGAPIINAYQSLIALTKAREITILKFVVNDTTLQVDAQIGSGQTVKFNLTNSLVGQVDTVKTVLASQPQNAKTVIDVRVPGNLYLK